MKGDQSRFDQEEWFVAHLKPRCEKNFYNMVILRF